MSDAYINLTTLLSARGYDKGMYFTHEECSSLFSLINARDSRIAELEAENAMLKQLPQPIKFWSDEKKQIYKINERRTVKSGSKECGE